MADQSVLNEWIGCERWTRPGWPWLDSRLDDNCGAVYGYPSGCPTGNDSCGILFAPAGGHTAKLPVPERVGAVERCSLHACINWCNVLLAKGKLYVEGR